MILQLVEGEEVSSRVGTSPKGRPGPWKYVHVGHITKTICPPSLGLELSGYVLQNRDTRRDLKRRPPAIWKCAEFLSN
jgi:hypothetical protein